ncbi:MAG: delta-class carbonic anhydrase [Gammaproteobacteria bacterium]
MLLPFNLIAKDTQSAANDTVADRVINQQRQNLSTNTDGKGFGPQSPRDIDSISGSNQVAFNAAPSYSQMNLCNIHFHKNAEHKGGEFTKYAGNGNGQGYKTGFIYSGNLTKKEVAPVSKPICPSDYGNLYPGDTIEVHYVHSTAQVKPGPTLGSCLNDAIKNPQLRVETQIYVLVNDKDAGDFITFTQFGKKDGFHQALNIPQDTGIPIQYAGSTTGPSYNEQGSPFQVTWSVRSKVIKVDINSVGKWCESNVFNEDHAHGVRNLVTNPDLLSEIK